MVQQSNPGRDPRGKAAPPPPPAPVKLELEDPLDDAHSPLDKRPRLSSWGAAAPYNLLDEPSPLGLRLRKSPSLLDLIQMRLSKSAPPPPETSKGAAAASAAAAVAAVAADKMKASNFPVALLKIGTWECVSRYEGDLVAKCYFAKHKLVWEVLEGGLKSKIEIQWSDITALKASFPENGPGTLDIVLVRQPLFFRETNPQPRKHTLWQATSDFTGGQASIQRRHFLQCAHGLLNKHYEKLIQCDPRLYSLSQQSDTSLESPYFETRCSVFDDQDESKSHGFDNLKDAGGSTISRFKDLGSPSAPSVSATSEARDSHGRIPENVSRETPSPTSVIDSRVEENTIKGIGESKSPRIWDQFKVPGLRGSMSMCDLVSHIGQCISEQRTPGNPFLSADGSPNKDMLDDLAQYLLSDSQPASDEQSLMMRVESLCCLLDKDGTTPTDGSYGTDVKPCSLPGPSFERRPMFDLSSDEFNDVSAYKQPPPTISRKDSFGELLMHLPRIASIPQVLFKITEDSDNQAR